MKCPKCNGDRMATYTSTSTWFQPNSEPFESGVLEKIETIETYVDVGVHHCLECGHEIFWLEDPRSPLEAEVERLRELLAVFLKDNRFEHDRRHYPGLQCIYCDAIQNYGQPFLHADDCPATLARVELGPAP